MRTPANPAAVVWLACLAAAGCRAPTRAVADATVAAGTSSAVLARVNGRAIVAADLPADVHARLERLDGSCAQRRYALRWAGLEEAIGEALLADAARGRGVSLEALLAEEIESKVAEPSEAEIQALYAAHRETIDEPEAEAAPELRRMWRRERVRDLRRALVDRLRADAIVEAHLPPPRLPRLAMPQPPACRAGPARAPVQLVAFASYSCPYSAELRRILARLRELYPDDVQIAYRHLAAPGDRGARRAALAAGCACEGRKFWELHELLYEHHDALTEATIVRDAVQAGLDATAVARCTAGDAARARLEADRREAEALGVSGTPTVFLNGMRIDGALPLPLMQALVERELAGTTVAEPTI